MLCQLSQTTLYLRDRRWRLGLSGDGDGVRLNASYRHDGGARLELTLRHLEVSRLPHRSTLRLTATVATVIEVRASGIAGGGEELAAAGRELLAQVLHGRVEATAPSVPSPMRRTRLNSPRAGRGPATRGRAGSACARARRRSR